MFGHMGQLQSVWSASSRVTPKQQSALIRIASEPRFVRPATLEHITEEIYDRAAFDDPFAHPMLLAHANDVLVCPTLEENLRCWSVEGDRVLYYPILASGRKLGELLYHELAHVLLRRNCLKHDHGDVYALAMTLMAPRPWIIANLAASGGQGAMTEALVRCNRYAPRHLLSLRVRNVMRDLESESEKLPISPRPTLYTGT